MRILSFPHRVLVITCAVIIAIAIVALDRIDSTAATGTTPFSSSLATPSSSFISPLATPMLLPTPIPSGMIIARVGTAKVPLHTIVRMSNQPPVRSSADLKQIKTLRESHVVTMPLLPAGDPKARQAQWLQMPPETAVTSVSQAMMLQALAAPGDFTLFRNTQLRSFIPITASGIFNEPTAANRGAIVFQTGNTYAALSTDGGTTFQYIDPRTQFPNLYGGFCCDQVAVYDPSRDLMFWLLLYERNSTQNAFRLAVSRGSDIASGIWTSYMFVSTSGTWYDFPDLALSDNYLWITANRFPITPGAVPITDFVFKVPLDDLQSGGGINYSYFDTYSNGLSNASLRSTRGAKSTMYFGSHNSDTQLRVFHWDETGNTIPYNDINLSPGWNLVPPYSCPGPDGRDWCGAEDGRIRGAWIANGIIGFMWASNAHGSFPRPYIEVARIYESNITLKDRPVIWNSSYAFMYPAASPNVRGDIGIDLFYGGGSFYPTGAVGLDDDLNGDPATTGWETYSIVASTSGPDVNHWGDYVSVVPFIPNSIDWVATTFSLQGCPYNSCSYPQFLVFGRERDRWAVACYLFPSSCVYLPLVIKDQ